MGVDYADDDYIFDTHWLALKRAIEGNAIVSGMAVTPNATQPPIEVDIASGVFYAGGNRIVYAGGSQALDAADVTNDRWDLISGKSAGGLRYTAGTPSADPAPPDLPAGDIIIAMIYVVANETEIEASHIREFGFLSGLLELQTDFDAHDHSVIPLGPDVVDTAQIADDAVTQAETGGFDKAYLTKNAAQSIPNNALTAVTWNTEVFDTGGIHSGSDSKITIQKTGYYMVCVNIHWAASALGDRYLVFYKDTAPAESMQQHYSPGFSVSHNQAFACILSLEAGKEYTLYVYQTSGSALNIQPTGSALGLTSLSLTLLPDP